MSDSEYIRVHTSEIENGIEPTSRSAGNRASARRNATRLLAAAGGVEDPQGPAARAGRKISAKCCLFSAVSAPIFARKYAFCSIFQNLPDSQAEIFEI